MAATNQQPTTDTAKYDRQLRLWGEEGQALLESAHVALLNATATGTETLKNLVLPGIGKFTIIDGKKVDDSDFNNFFIQSGSQGQSRAQVATELLNELNDRVHGTAVDRDPVDIIEKDPNYFKQFTVIIANNIPEQPLLKLSEVCWGANIALLVVRSWGLLGYLRVVTPEHTIVESKPDNPADDLRLSQPWPELEQYALSLDFSKMDSTEHSHTPYVVILLQHAAKWKKEHGGKLPEGSAERNQFRDGVIKATRKSDEENFNEAYKAAYKAATPIRISSQVQAILNDEKATNITPQSTNFWILAHALKGFVANEGNGLLPLNGAIPDMTASTDNYIALQKIYQAKAIKDFDAVSVRVHAALKQIGRDADSIPAETIKKFCKNSNFLSFIRYRSLHEERDPSTAKVSYLASELADKESNMNWYIALRGVDRFYTQHHRYPGDVDANVAGDVTALTSIVAQLLAELNLKDVTIDDRYIQETVRYGGAELHPIAALVGGVASQEAIKLITHQFSPADNTFLFNGLRSTSTSAAL